VFVVSAGSTSPEVARAALDRLTSVKARIVGAVLNRADLSPRSEYHYGYKTANADA
jgi:Mrp family chromosome partitioning ATPase